MRAFSLLTRITASLITMREIAHPRAELPRATAVLYDRSPATLAIHRRCGGSLHFLWMGSPPGHSAFRGAEALLQMPGSLHEMCSALRAGCIVNGTDHRYLPGIPLGGALTEGLYGID